MTDRSRSSIFNEKSEQGLFVLYYLFGIIRSVLCSCIHKINSSPLNIVWDFQKSHLCDQTTNILKSSCCSKIMETETFVSLWKLVLWGFYPSGFRFYEAKTQTVLLSYVLAIEQCRRVIYRHSCVTFFQNFFT